MPRDGSGNYSAPAGQPVATGTSISSTVHNTLVTDLAAALTASVAKDGQTAASANLPMGGFRHSGVGNATARNQYLTVDQAQDNDCSTLGSVAGTNTITGNLTPAITAYVAGMHVTLIPGGNNTGATTLAINGLTALDVFKADGDALISGDLVSGVPAHLICDGDDFYLMNPQASLIGIAASDFVRGTQSNSFTAVGSHAAPNIKLDNNIPTLQLYEADAAANNRAWSLYASGEQLIGSALNDAFSAEGAWLTVDRTGATIDSIALAATSVTVNGVSVNSASILTAGTIPDARFPATLPAASGVNLTALNASNVASGTLADARLSANVALREVGSFTGTLTGMTGATTGTIYYDKTGGQVTLYTRTSITGTSNAGTMTLTGVPAGLRPANTKTVVCFGIVSSDIVVGSLLGVAGVGTGGTVSFDLLDTAVATGYAAIAVSGGLGFAATGTKGLGGAWSITYALD